MWIDNNNEIKFDLIFRMSKDGDQSKDFHNNCDNKDPTLILIETVKGYIFGGYTPLNWDNIGFQNDEETFIFSINKYSPILFSKKPVLHVLPYGSYRAQVSL